MPDRSKSNTERLLPIFEKNTTQVNQIIANILANCSIIILVMVFLSAVGFFEFGKTYTYILLIAGLFISLSPKIFMHLFSDTFMKYYMMISAAVFIGIIGADKNIGIYITYALVPILSGLYFDTSFVLKMSAFSYVVMVLSVYNVSANMAEVLYQGRPRMQIFLAYVAGFTIEYVIVTIVLYFHVKRAKHLVVDINMIEHEKNDAERERQIYNALCVNYTAAYWCDLKSDRMETIKRKDFSHSAQEAGKMHNPHCYSEWIHHAYETIVVKDTAPDYLEFFDAENLMRRLQSEESLVYRHQSLPNGAGMEHFETTIVRLYTDDNSFQIIMGYRPIDDIVAEEKKRQQMEQERLQEAYEIAETANKAKTTFLLNMSHDIRTPMNAIIGYTKLMRQKITNPELLHYQEMVEQSGNLLLSIINNILDMARIESGKMELDENYDETGNIVGSVCSVFEAEAKKKNLTITHSVEVEHPHIICDRTKMQELLTNLVSNAVKYTPPGGKITIVTRELPCEREGYVCFQTVVADTGIGMSAEFLPHLFDSFSRERDTTTAKVAGSGLGMAIVKSLVELMNGTIDVESELGKGTKFTVTVFHKIADEKYYKKEDLSESAMSADFSGKHILLAEDNELNAEIATAILKDMGFAVEHVEDGILCVDKLEKEPSGTYDLILMDIQMPNMDGYKATQVIRQLPDRQKSNIPVIAMTANAFEEDRKMALSKGMNGHITKPIDAAKIKEVMVSILKQSI